jgi:hypothetical protein
VGGIRGRVGGRRRSGRGGEGGRKKTSEKKEEEKGKTNLLKILNRKPETFNVIHSILISFISGGDDSPLKFRKSCSVLIFRWRVAHLPCKRYIAGSIRTHGGLHLG